jgi:hypothetical protein
MNKWKPKSLERTSLFPSGAYGLDSVQGYLEMSFRYDRSDMIINFNPADLNKFNSTYFHLCQLEKEGHLIIEWTPRITSTGENLIELKQLALTTSGHKLLSELRAKSRWGKVKERLTTIFWAVFSAVITTLLILAMKGK